MGLMWNSNHKVGCYFSFQTTEWVLGTLGLVKRWVFFPQSFKPPQGGSLGLWSAHCQLLVSSSWGAESCWCGGNLSGGNTPGHGRDYFEDHVKSDITSQNNSKARRSLLNGPALMGLWSTTLVFGLKTSPQLQGWWKKKMKTSWPWNGEMGNQEICSSVSSSLPVAMSSSSWSATPLTLKGSMWWSIRTQGFVDIARFYNFFGTHPNQSFWKMQYHDQEQLNNFRKSQTVTH